MFLFNPYKDIAFLRWGALIQRAEIIPNEPDADNAVAGILVKENEGSKYPASASFTNKQFKQCYNLQKSGY